MLNSRIKFKYCNSFPEYTNFKDDLIEYKYYVVTKIIKKSLMRS